MDNTCTVYTSCRFCKSKQLFPVIDLGSMPLAGGFLRSEEDFAKENKYPLMLYFCASCYLLQTNVVINREILFKNYFYYSSAISTLVDHFEKTAEELADMHSLKEKKKLLEIGCNDGAFLSAANKKGFTVVGIDPAENVVRKIEKKFPVVNDYFTEKAATKIKKQFGLFDVIFSSNTLAHIEDMHDVVKGIKKILTTDGMLVFEVHYVGKLLKEMQYDMMYHEHQYYYSLHALQNLFSLFDMTVFDVKQIPIHAGSIRVYVQKKQGKEKVTSRVSSLLAQERKDGLTKAKTFICFGNDIQKTKKDLINLLITLKKQRKKIVGYGASGRGTIIMNYCGLDKRYIDYVLDDAPAKQDAYMPGTHTKIISSDFLYTDKPDYVVLFAWSFVDEIKKKHKQFLKNGGKFIIPLPKVKIIEK